MLVVLGRVLVRPLRALLMSLEQPAFELPRLTLSRAPQNRLGHLPLLHGRRKSCRNRFGHPRRECTRTRKTPRPAVSSQCELEVLLAAFVPNRLLQINPFLTSSTRVPLPGMSGERRAVRRPASE